MLTGALILSLIALISAIRTPIIYKVTNLPFLLFGISFFGHGFAGPLLVLSGVLTLWAAADGAVLAMLLSAGAAATYAFNLQKSHQSQKVFEGVMPASQSQGTETFLETAMLPLKIRQPGVKRLKDIAYGEAGERNLLDIYTPDVPQADPLPILIHIHGGAWMVGQKKQQSQPLIQHLASKGWMVVDINYRLGPLNKFPEIFSDILRAIGWVKRHAADYGGDANFVAITGGSAGGHLAALAALMPDNVNFKKGFEDSDCRVDAAVPVYGIYDFLGTSEGATAPNEGTEDFLTKNVMPSPRDDNIVVWETFSPFYQIHADAPPMLIIHGRKDTLAKFEGAEAFANALRRVSRNTVETAFLPSGEHAYDLVNSPPTPAHVRAIERFLDQVRQQKRSGKEAPETDQGVQAAE